MRIMRSRLPRLAAPVAFAALTMVSGCMATNAQVALPAATPLAIPPAPARVVLPPAPEPPPVVTVDPVAPAGTTVATPPANPTRPTRETRPPTPSAPPPAAPPATPTTTAPATPLETQANQSELEQRARGLLASAEKTLEKIDYRALSADGKAQYDTAKRFVTQAKEALTAKNIVYAWQLADKANTIATLLQRL